MKRSGFKRQSKEVTAARRKARKIKRKALDAALSIPSARPERELELAFKRAVRKRDGCTCQFPGCTIKYSSIPVHHIAPRSQRPDLKYEVSNGLCVCEPHHRWIHDHPKESAKRGLLNRESYELARKNKESSHLSSLR